MPNDLMAKLDTVSDEASFADFLSALAADRAESVAKEKVKPSSPYGPDSNGWENTSIEHFLESASAWATDSRHSPHLKVSTNPWKRCADIIYAGKIYE